MRGIDTSTAQKDRELLIKLWWSEVTDSANKNNEDKVTKLPATKDKNEMGEKLYMNTNKRDAAVKLPAAKDIELEDVKMSSPLIGSVGVSKGDAD